MMVGVSTALAAVSNSSVKEYFSNLRLNSDSFTEPVVATRAGRMTALTARTPSGDG